MNLAIIVAGGSGERSGLNGGKQLADLGGAPVLARTIESFDRCDAIDEIVVVTHPERVEEYRRLAIDPLASRKVRAVVPGGETRQRSVEAGIAAAPEGVDVIAVHDGARPLVTPELIALAVAALLEDPELDGIVVGHPAYDTIKVVDQGERVVSTADRSVLWVAQTPQVFRAGVLKRAYASAAAEGYAATDDASLVERMGGSVRMLPGPRDNIKITAPEDLLVVERLFEARGEAGDG